MSNADRPTFSDPRITHEHLFSVIRRLPSDYTHFGGQVERWKSDDLDYPDCSGGCRWAAWLEPPYAFDWCVCTKPDAPRCGLLTFEHQAGFGCFEDKEIVKGGDLEG